MPRWDSGSFFTQDGSDVSVLDPNTGRNKIDYSIPRKSKTGGGQLEERRPSKGHTNSNPDATTIDLDSTEVLDCAGNKTTLATYFNIKNGVINDKTKYSAKIIGSTPIPNHPTGARNYEIQAVKWQSSNASYVIDNDIFGGDGSDPTKPKDTIFANNVNEQLGISPKVPDDTIVQVRNVDSATGMLFEFNYTGKSFLANIFIATTVGTNRWAYQFSEVTLSSSGLASSPINARAGVALNLLEFNHSATTAWGVDLTNPPTGNYPTGFSPLPVGTNGSGSIDAYVMMQEYHFDNGVDGYIFQAMGSHDGPCV